MDSILYIFVYVSFPVSKHQDSIKQTLQSPYITLDPKYLCYVLYLNPRKNPEDLTEKCIHLDAKQCLADLALALSCKYLTYVVS